VQEPAFLSRQILVNAVPGARIVPSGMETSPTKEARSQGSAVGGRGCVAVGTSGVALGGAVSEAVGVGGRLVGARVPLGGGVVVERGTALWVK